MSMSQEMTVVCAWHPRELPPMLISGPPPAGRPASMISHGICRACSVALLDGGGDGDGDGGEFREGLSPAGGSPAAKGLAPEA